MEQDESADTVGDLPPPRPKKARAPKSKSSDTITLSSLSSVPSTSSGSDIRPVSSSSVVAMSTARMVTTTVRSQPILTIGGGGGCVVRTFSSSSVESIQQVGKQRSASSVQDRSVEEERFALTPGTFDVMLCVDNQEIHGNGCVRSKTDVILELKKHGVAFDVRNLKVGDFLWVAREKSHLAVGRKPRELVLDFIAERKRGDDLAVSIKDGRYTDQKYRMKETTIKRVIYIIEDCSRFMNKGLSDQALIQALANIKVQDGFVVKETENLRATVEYLLRMTRYLERIYSVKTLRSTTFAERWENAVDLDLSSAQQELLSFAGFSSVAKPNQAKTVSQTFLMQLLALDGMSPAKASAVVSVYPTIRALIAAYDACLTQDQKETMLKDVKFGLGMRTIGLILSKKVCRLYCTEESFRI
ncbi:crossover junction endonuclease MUS81-like [Paramacrobiotus metropolitanus]|uniref:crossover junction endonuclease MUS81-like n=1 Tax=Paramacrobiotus metropolitanus TaxID=2943436 RepID=UPI002445C4BD|nr:crossover junction endonuclease MUS81-like [Paramacrobiotus metropolitanus]